MWIVMAGGLFGVKRSFETNATDIATEEEAKAEAERRNAVERAAGRTEDDVLWFPMEWPSVGG